MAVVSDPWFTSMQALDGQLVLTLEPRKRFLEMGDHQWVDVIGSLRWHETAVARIKSRFRRYQDFAAYRMLNFPETLAGMTVFAPAALNAPSIPWIDKLGDRMRPIRTETLSLDNAMEAPAASSISVML